LFGFRRSWGKNCQLKSTTQYCGCGFIPWQRYCFLHWKFSDHLISAECWWNLFNCLVGWIHNWDDAGRAGQRIHTGRVIVRLYQIIEIRVHPFPSEVNIMTILGCLKLNSSILYIGWLWELGGIEISNRRISMNIPLSSVKMGDTKFFSWSFVLCLLLLSIFKGECKIQR
jgi:hypothetical protein